MDKWWLDEFKLKKHNKKDRVKMFLITILGLGSAVAFCAAGLLDFIKNGL